MKTIIKKGELLSELTHVDEELFKDSLEEIFWEDVDSAFSFSSTSLRIDWKDDIPIRMKVELTDYDYGDVNCMTITTFLLNKKEFVSYIAGCLKNYEDFNKDEYTTYEIDNHILNNILISFIGSLRRYSDEMNLGASNENNFFE